jgi:hypothetical protein
MKGKRKYSDEQIVAILLEHQGGVSAKEVIRQHGIPQAVSRPSRRRIR